MVAEVFLCDFQSSVSMRIYAMFLMCKNIALSQKWYTSFVNIKAKEVYCLSVRLYAILRVMEKY